MNYEKIVLVKKETPLEGLLKRHATTSQVKFYLESRGENYDFYHSAHLTYLSGLHHTTQSILSEFRTQVVDKEHLDTFQFGDKDIVLVVGDPGLFVNVAKYVGSQPVICVNPDPQRYADTFTSCTIPQLPLLLDKVRTEKINLEYLTMAQAKLNDGQVLYALNDLFIGQKTHVSSRYSIEYKQQIERQSSSGIIVSTGTGSTGWLTSIMTGAYGLSLGDQAEIPKNVTPRNVTFSREENYLQFVVREPFPSKVTGTTILKGEIDHLNPLKLISNMPENGVIFSDGIESDYLEFNAGAIATIQPADRKVRLVKP